MARRGVIRERLLQFHKSPKSLVGIHLAVSLYVVATAAGITQEIQCLWVFYRTRHLPQRNVQHADSSSQTELVAWPTDILVWPGYFRIGVALNSLLAIVLVYVSIWKYWHRRAMPALAVVLCLAAFIPTKALALGFPWYGMGIRAWSCGTSEEQKSVFRSAIDYDVVCWLQTYSISLITFSAVTGAALAVFLICSVVLHIAHGSDQQVCDDETSCKVSSTMSIDIHSKEKPESAV